MKKLKYGIIGCGGIAQSKHAQAFNAIKNEVEVVALCDIIEAKAIECKNPDRFDCPNAQIFTDYKELLKLDLDAVLVLTPNKSHSFITVDALRSGKNVMVEKPMAINTLEAQKMIDAANETGKILTVAYQNRYRTDSLYLKEACENGDLGDIYYAKAHAVRRKAVPTWGVFMNEDEQGGGPLIDIGTHALDLAMWTMNNYKPRMVVGTKYNKLTDKPDGNAFGNWDPKEFTVEDSAFGFIVMEDGATIYLESSWALNTLDVKEAKCTLCGTEGGADMEKGLTFNNSKYGKLDTTTIDLSVGGVPFFEGASYQEQHREAITFLRALKGEGELLVKPEQAIIVTKILEAIYESNATGKAVYFE